MSSTYQADEFENPDENGPVGAHRRPPSRWRPVLPFLLILVLVPLLAWGFTYLLQRDGDGLLSQSGAGNQSAATQQSQSAAEPQSSDTSAAQSSDEPSEEPSEEPEPEIDYGTAVEVLNSTGIQGYAAEVAGYITNDGFSTVSAGNTSGWITEENTVFYSGPDQKATAERIAELAGIDSVREDTEATGGSGVVVLLVS